MSVLKYFVTSFARVVVVWGQSLEPRVCTTIAGLWEGDRTQPRQRVLLFAHQQKMCKQVGSSKDNPAIQILSPKPVGTLASRAADETYQQVALMQRRVASAVLLTGGQLWASFLERVRSMINSGVWQPLVIGKRRKYDETPLKVRTQETEPSRTDQGNASQTGLAAKIMQTEFKLFVLMRRVADNSFAHIEGRVPTCLQVVDSCSAKTVAASQQALEDTVGNLQSVSKLFPLRVTLPCTDKHASNSAAEAVLGSLHPGWVRAHTFCGIHRVSTTTKATCALVEGHVSGAIAIAQALQFAGSTRALRQHLQAIISERLQVHVGPPQHEDYRNALYDLLLSPVSTARSGKQARHLRKRQRMVLRTLLNGDVQLDNVVQHWCAAPRSRQQVLDDMVRFAIPALVPHVCPTLNRGSFLGHEAAFRWIGLLALMHNLLEPLICRFVGHNQKPSKPLTPSMPDPLAADPEASWASVAGRPRVLLGSLAQPSRDPADATQASMIEVDLEPIASHEAFCGVDGNVSWEELNRATRRKAALYVCTKPGPTLALIMIALQPVQNLTRSLIHLGSEAWEAEQQALSSQGKQRSYRVLELFRGRQTQRFMQGVAELMSQPPAALPVLSQTLGGRCLLFRMASRNASAVQMILRDVHASCPFKLAGLVDEQPRALLDTRPCMRDALCSHFTRMFPTPEGMSSDIAKNMASSILLAMDVDVLDIEAKHSSTRRIVTMQSCQTWPLEFALLSAEFTTRQQVTSKGRFLPVVKKTKTQPKQPKRGRALNKGRGGFGGPWRQLISQNSRGRGRGRGGGRHKLNIAETKSQFRKLKFEGGPEWEQLVIDGRLATERGRRKLEALKSGAASSSEPSAAVGCGMQPKLPPTDPSASAPQFEPAAAHLQLAHRGGESLALALKGSKRNWKVQNAVQMRLAADNQDRAIMQQQTEGHSWQPVFCQQSPDSALESSLVLASKPLASQPASVLLHVPVESAVQDYEFGIFMCSVFWSS